MEDEKFVLTRNQQQVFDLVETTQDNILICGKPGVGKSVLIRALVNDGNKTYTLAAPTGLAALNIGGRTLHSIFRLPISGGILAPDFNQFPTDDRVVNNIRYNIKHLIIDEISMVRADTLDYIDRMLKHIKGSDKPFGGVQIIAVGDFFQLPPVVVRHEKIQLQSAGYPSPFAFDAHCATAFNIVELSEVLRQKGDNGFINFLDKARTGYLLPGDLRALNDRVESLDGLRISLTATNAQAQRVNESKLRSLEGSPVFYNADKYGEWPALPTDENLALKVGAQVMVRMNGADRPEGFKGEFESRVVNGTLAVVKELLPNKVLVALGNGEEVWIYKKRWERKVKERTEEGWEERVVASFAQIPLTLAWAISIHKSQGQTFEAVHINAQRIFAAGQLYVALSRSKSLQGITLESPVTTSKFFADKNVIRWSNEKLN